MEEADRDPVRGTNLPRLGIFEESSSYSAIPLPCTRNVVSIDEFMSDRMQVHCCGVA